jgi:DNA-binding MarR family transcriptional regulator
MRHAKTPKKLAVRLPCACANLRRADRVITRFYDAALRPSGMRVTQFTLLQALDRVPGTTQKQLAELLAMDSTTLTRSLTPLRRKGWLRSEMGADRREHRFSMTASGRREYERVLPYWQTAQKNLHRALGAEGWNRLLDATVELAGVDA